ncbi:204_t:CDS:1, partial [Dentiscutata heterogama]
MNKLGNHYLIRDYVQDQIEKDFYNTSSRKSMIEFIIIVSENLKTINENAWEYLFKEVILCNKSNEINMYLMSQNEIFKLYWDENCLTRIIYIRFWGNMPVFFKERQEWMNIDQKL